MIDDRPQFRPRLSGSQGLAATTTDPRGIVNANFYNLLGGHRNLTNNNGWAVDSPRDGTAYYTNSHKVSAHPYISGGSGDSGKFAFLGDLPHPENHLSEAVSYNFVDIAQVTAGKLRGRVLDAVEWGFKYDPNLLNWSPSNPAGMTMVSQNFCENGGVGDGNLTQAARSQTTAWVYGVSTSTGSTIDSNDLLDKVEYPNATTGAAITSASDDVSYNGRPG